MEGRCCGGGGEGGWWEAGSEVGKVHSGEGSGVRRAGAGRKYSPRPRNAQHDVGRGQVGARQVGRRVVWWQAGMVVVRQGKR